jgi:hypothetical protein
MSEPLLAKIECRWNLLQYTVVLPTVDDEKALRIMALTAKHLRSHDASSGETTVTLSKDGKMVKYDIHLGQSVDEIRENMRRTGVPMQAKADHPRHILKHFFYVYGKLPGEEDPSKNMMHAYTAHAPFFADAIVRSVAMALAEVFDVIIELRGQFAYTEGGIPYTTSDKQHTSVRMHAVDPFTILVLGGADDEGFSYGDAVYRRTFPNCNVFSVGNHSKASVMGDWKDAATWDEVRKLKPQPHAVVIDMGSDSWLTPDVGVHLAAYLQEPVGPRGRSKMLVFSPPWEDYKPTFKFFDTIAKTHYMDPESAMRYKAVRICQGDVLIALSDHFDEQARFPSEVLAAVHKCQELMFKKFEFCSIHTQEMRKELEAKRIKETKLCFDDLGKRFGQPMPYLVALQHIFAQVTGLVNPPTDTKCK